MTEIFEDEAGGWRFRVKGKNGENVVTSEGYTTPGDAERGLETLQRIMDEARAHGLKPVRVPRG